MKNFKLILKSLINNNAAIDGGRKKPWYFAIIILFVGLILSLVPIGVTELNAKLDVAFEDNSYLTQEATTEFAKHLSGKDDLIYVVHNKKEKSHTLVATADLNFDYHSDAYEKNLFKFRFVTNDNVETLMNEDYMKDVSYFIFTQDSIFIKVVNPNDGTQVLNETFCRNAYKKVGDHELTNSYKEVKNESNVLDFKKSSQETWKTWRSLIRKFHTSTRLASAGYSVMILGFINFAITFIMGVMLFVLTRGKTNAYRLFKFWECEKIAFWSILCPGLITCGLGFLIAGLAKTLFPLFVAVRVMWLSMKSLKPDGSGYAAE